MAFSKNKCTGLAVLFSGIVDLVSEEKIKKCTILNHFMLGAIITAQKQTKTRRFSSPNIPSLNNRAKFITIIFTRNGTSLARRRFI